MIVFFVFLTLFSSYAATKSTEKCSATDQAQFLECRKYAEVMEKKIKENPMNGKTFPPQSAFQDIAVHCNKTVECLSKIDCDEATKSLPIFKLSCEAIEFMAGPFATCFARVSKQPPSKEKYPCAKNAAFNKTNKDSKCNLFTIGMPCLELVVKDICGEEAVKDFEKGAHLMQTIHNCHKQT